MLTKNNIDLQSEVEEDIIIELDDNIKEFTVSNNKTDVKDTNLSNGSAKISEDTSLEVSKSTEIAKDNNDNSLDLAVNIEQKTKAKKEPNKFLTWINSKIIIPLNIKVYTPIKNSLIKFGNLIKKYYRITVNFILDKYTICEKFIISKLDVYVVQKLNINSTKFFSILRKVKWFIFSKKFLIPFAIVLICISLYSGSSENAISELRSIPKNNNNASLVKQVRKNSETISDSNWFSHVDEMAIMATNTSYSIDVRKAMLNSLNSSNTDNIPYVKLFPLLTETNDEDFIKTVANVLKLNDKKQNEIDFITYSRDILNKDNKKLIESFTLYTKYKLGETKEIYLLDIDTVDLCSYYITGTLTEEDFLGFTKKTNANELTIAFIESYKKFLTDNNYEAFATLNSIFDKHNIPSNFFNEDVIANLREASSIATQRNDLAKKKSGLAKESSELSNIESQISELDNKLESSKSKI